MKNIDLRNNLILYNNNPAGFIKDKKATLDNIFKTDELSEWLELGGYETSWQDGVFEKLAVNCKCYQIEDIAPLKNVRIWQLNDDFEYGGRFLSFDDMVAKYGELRKSDYKCVYDGDMGTNDLEEIYSKCNLEYPEGYKGHSLSISDIVELYNQQENTKYYVDRFGFKKVTFSEQTQIQEIEMQTM